MRLQPVERMPLILRPFSFVARRMFGKDLTPSQVYARRPGILLAFNGLMAAVEFSKAINSRIKRLVCIRAAQIIGCPF